MELIRKVFIPLWLEASLKCGRGGWVDEVLVETLVPIIVGVSSVRMTGVSSEFLSRVGLTSRSK